MNWDDLKVFLALSRQGSARAAAEKLGLHHSTVTRRIESFESTQKMRLFDRLHTGYRLTAAGESLMQSAIRVEEEINGIERNLLGTDSALVGDIRVTMPDAVGTHLLMPYIVRFMDTYPDIDVKVNISYDLLSLTKRETDVAIRLSDAPPEHLVGRKVIRYHTAVYATKHYVEAHDFSTDASVLRPKACWIGWHYPKPCSEWIRESPFPHLRARGYFNNVLAQLSAVKSGLGIAHLPCFIGDLEPELQRVPPVESRPFQDIWILTHKDLLSTSRIQTFMDFMVIAFREKQDILRGQCW